MVCPTQQEYGKLDTPDGNPEMIPGSAACIDGAEVLYAVVGMYGTPGVLVYAHPGLARLF
jgi:hypothetical protein